MKRKQVYTILLILIFVVNSYILTSRDSRYSIIGMVSVLLILELGRLKNRRYKVIIPAVLLAVFFAVFGTVYIKYFSLTILLSLILSLKIKMIQKKNHMKFTDNINELELKQKIVEKKYIRSKRRSEELEDESNRFLKLYDLSKEIEEVISSKELAEKSLESLNFRINVDKSAFYNAASTGYEILKTRNIDKNQAISWLGDNSDKLFKFYLKAQDKKLGLIICKGKLNTRQLRAAEVLIYQITLGYEKTILYEKVKELSRVDGLTGLYLRKHFFERLSEEMKRAKRERYRIAFIMADLDNFKNYNDTHGHPMGDKLLKEVTNIIKDNVYSSDLAARYGGEEFCIYMPMAIQKGTIKTAEKIRKLIEKNTAITISIGISYFPDAGSSPEDLVKAADTALYNAKEKGKNQIYVN